MVVTIVDTDARLKLIDTGYLLNNQGKKVKVRIMKDDKDNIIFSQIGSDRNDHDLLYFLHFPAPHC